MTKKILFALTCVLLTLFLGKQVAMAANNVTDIDVDVVLYEDGSAYITQTWNCKFEEGTECYIPISNLGDMSISNFLVSDVKGAYTLVEDWDINAGFDEKKNQYGMVETDNGYELCWGISEYGDRRYAIEYKINDMVGSYTDYDGFNFQFINSGMGTLPTNVTVSITTQDGIELTTENCGIWAFGFDGQIVFEEGNISAYTETPLTNSTDSVIIMVQLDKGLLNPQRTVNDSFEKVKSQAMSGSDYNQDTSDDYSVEDNEEGSITYDIVGFIFVLAGPIIIIIVIVLLINVIINKSKRNKKLAMLYSSAEYFREAPVDGNIEATFALAKDFDLISNEGNLIGAAFLKLINAGCLEPINETTVSLFGKEKESISLRLVKPPEFPGKTVNKLYDVLIAASSTDQILQEKELEKYCNKNFSAILDIVKEAKSNGINTLVQYGTYDSSKSAKPLGLTLQGETLLSNIIGFKKYLLEFSLIGERGIEESIIWQDYLTFATLLGIADRAILQFEKVYPNTTQYSENAHYHNMLALRYMHVSYVAAQTASSSYSGGGGSSSFGGGGGFSGGGSGGGTR